MKNTFVKVLSFLMALTMIVGTLGTVVVFAADECTHENATYVEVPATCKSIGYKKFHCGDCGEDYIGDVVPAKDDHNLVYYPATNADCDKPAYTEGWKCADCDTYRGDIAGKPLPQPVGNKLGHRWGTYSKYVEKTCDEGAYTVYQCIRCDEWGNKEYDSKNPASHEYIYKVDQELTACISAQVTITCSECDFKDVIVQEASHDYVKMTATNTDEKAPLAGDQCNHYYATGRYCKDCYAVEPGYTLNENRVHDFENMSGTGSITYKGKTINKLGDTITAENASTEITSIVVDGANLTIGSVTSVAPGCDTDGWYIGFCKICGQWDKVVDAATGTNKQHAWGAWSPWTTTETDDTAATFDNTKDAAHIQASKYHAYNFTATRECSECEAKDTRTVAASGHNYDPKDNKTYVSVYPVTCTENGYTLRQCNKCSYNEKINVVLAKGYHSFEVEGANPVYVKVKGYNCADPAKSKVVTTCTHPECDTARSLTDTTKTAATHEKDDNVTAHTWTHNDVVPGTCMVASHYQDKCSYCDATQAYYGGDATKDAFKDYKDSKLDPDNHVAKNGAEGTYLTKGSVVKSQVLCTDEETTYFVCNCRTRIEVVTKAAGKHTIVVGGNTKDDNKVAVYHAAGCTADDVIGYTHADGCTLGQQVTTHAEGCPVAAGTGTACLPECTTADGQCVAECEEIYGKCVTEGDDVCLNFEPVAATCVKTGMTGGELCTKCGYIQKAPEVAPINSNNHSTERAAGTTDIVVKPNCKSAGYTAYNCKDCYELVIVDKKVGDTVKPDSTYHVTVEKVAAKAPSCIYDGNTEYYFCDDCDKYFATANVTVELDDDNKLVAFTADPKNAKALSTFVDKSTAKDHTWTKFTSVGKNVPTVETCADAAFNEFYFCVKCYKGDASKMWIEQNFEDLPVIKLKATGKTVVDNPATTDTNEAYDAIYIAAHGAIYTKNWSTTLVKKNADETTVLADCTTGAWEVVPNELKCLYCDLGADRNSTDKIVGTTNNGYWKNALGHEHGSVIEAVNAANAAGKVLDCSKPSYEWVKCNRCDDTLLANYKDPKSTEGHKLPTPDSKGVYASDDLEKRDAECEKAGAYYIECEYCVYTKDVEVIPATGHFVLSGVGEDAVATPISFECEYLDTYRGFRCDGKCGAVVGDIVKHNPVSVKVEATCTTDGYEVKYCADCNEQFANNNNYEKATGHDSEIYKNIAAAAPADKAAADTRISAGQNATHKLYRCHDCGEVYEGILATDKLSIPTVTLSATASAEAVKAGDTVSVAIKASATTAVSTLQFSVSYDSAKFALAEGDKAVTVNAAYADKAVAFASAANGVVTVIVFVQNTDDGKEQTIDLKTAAELLTINFVAKKYANGKSDKFVPQVAVTLNEKPQSASATASKEVVVSGFGNVNGDAIISVNDVKAVKAAVGTVNAEFDFNGDGLVDIDDYNLIAKFVATPGQSAKAYLVMIGVYAEIEAYVADMYANNEGYDFTNDNTMNNNDAYKLLKQVDTILNGYTSYTAIDFESVAEIVDQAVSALLK